MAVVLPLPLGEGWGEGTAALIAIAAFWVALAIDWLWGEPPVRFHPVVWIGRYLDRAGRLIAPASGTTGASQGRVFIAGMLAWCAGAVLVALAAWAVMQGAAQLPAVLAVPVVAIVLKTMLAWRMLRDEVLAVEAALGMSLDAGRARLGRLVSRDVSALGEVEVRESAIESLSENLNDSLVAPVFWFVLFGLPGAALYRYANTADAMWGYPGERDGRDWQSAGKWAARVDDVLSWLPARLTALLLALAVRRWPRGLRCEARRTPSPNSGWPMATMALLLGVRLGKPGVYMLHAAGRDAATGDLSRAVSWCARVVWLAALAATCALALLH